MKARWWWLLGLLFMLSAYAEVAVPELKQRVTDLTATLNAAQIQTLETKLADFEGKKGSQIGVLIVPTTQPETIEQYSIRVVDKWKLGRKGVDDGVLLLVAKNDRKLRIEVGRGLEGALNDATAKRIIAEIITPAFKQGDFAGGIAAGVDSIIKVVNGEALPSPPASLAVVENTDFDPEGQLGGLIIGLFLLIPLWLLIPSGKHKRGRNYYGSSGHGWSSGSSSSSSDSFSGGGGGFSGGGSSGSW
ncbi:MAG: YgcG family protein [Gallionella sp.]